jgi:membrane associated rhomboid family serine protease
MATDLTTCYRHPDRRAGVKCQRCERWICPDCMRQASVGFHCPECVRAAPQKVYRAGQLPATVPYVTYVLVAINAAVFLFDAITSAQVGDAVTSASGDLYVDGALIGGFQNAAGGVVPFGVSDGELWRIFTSGFLHAGVLHLAMNMLFLYLLGPMLERELGRVNFVALYFTSMLAGSFGVMLIDPFSPTVGASGALYGLLGAAVALQLSRGINPWSSGIGGLIFINVLITFTIPGISIGGHLGGLVGGFAAGWVLMNVDNWLDDKRVSRVVGPLLCLVMAALFAVGAVWAAEYAVSSGSAVIAF